MGLLLEMVIDPVCAFVFEAEEADPDNMQRPPRPPNERLFSWDMIGWSLLQGGLAFALLGIILPVLRLLVLGRLLRGLRRRAE